MLGQTLAHYEVTAHLGTGGMGEVYRAQDTKLRRDVAIKLLPAQFAADPGRMARFEQEARALAALNHPNVSGIYGIEQHEDLRFLVMELAEGEDLSERLKRGPLPLDDAVDIARQIAAGLEDAHARGIVHRDLKPANIKLRPDGTVKILDFGLAKALTDEPDPSTDEYDIANSPTIMNTVTQPGIILGTAAYMSPEQARGRPVDWRSDIWAFGCVLYEMLTSQPVYSRPTVTDTLAAIIERQPDFAQLPSTVPPALRRLLLRCLVKDHRNRLQSVGDARVVLQEIQAGKSEADDAPAAPGRNGRRWIGLSLVAVVSAVLGSAGDCWRDRAAERTAERSAAPGPALQLTLVLPEDYPLYYVGGSELGTEFKAFGLNGDATRLVYLTRSDVFRGLIVLDLVTGEHRTLTGTEGAFLPNISPDGAWVAFVSQGAIKRVPMAGGTVDQLASVSDATDLFWSRDGHLYWLHQQGRVLARMRPELGAPVETLLEPCNCGMVSDWVVPGEILLWKDNRFVRLGPDGTLTPTELRGGRTVIVGENIALLNRSGRVVATRVTPDGVAAGTTSRTVLTGVRTTPLTGRAQYTLSASGVLAYVAGPPGDVTRIVRRYPDGRLEPLPFDPRAHGSMNLLPDGSRLAVVMTDGAPGAGLEVLDLGRGTREVVGDATRASMPIWAADGAALTFSVRTDSVWTLVNHPVDSIDPPQELFARGANLTPWDWTRDGAALLYGTGEAGLGSIEVWDRASGESRKLITPVSGMVWGAQFSPDERFVAYTQVGDAGSEVYVVPYPPTGQRWLVSAGLGEEPVWRADTKEIVFRRGQGWYRVAYDDAEGIRFGAPELMFEGPFVNIGGMEFQVLADGSLLLLESVGRDERTGELQVILNWKAQLERIVGGGE